LNAGQSDAVRSTRAGIGNAAVCQSAPAAQARCAAAFGLGVDRKPELKEACRARDTRVLSFALDSRSVCLWALRQRGAGGIAGDHRAVDA
jgi:hypothetical protein